MEIRVSRQQDKTDRKKVYTCVRNTNSNLICFLTQLFLQHQHGYSCFSSQLKYVTSHA